MLLEREWRWILDGIDSLEILLCDSWNPTSPTTQTELLCRGLASLGHNLSLPMDVDFQVAVPDESSAMSVAREAQRLGYSTRIWHDDDERDLEPDMSLFWTCECTKRLVPEYLAIVAIQEELDQIARPFGGYSDGWGSFGNSGDA